MNHRSAAHANDQLAPHANATGHPTRASGRLLAALAGVVVIVAGGTYLGVGNRQAWSVGPDDDTAAPQAGSIEVMVSRLEARLKAQPEDAEGWAMLARSYAVLGRDADALPALRRAVELRPRDALALADYADGLATVAGGSLAGAPEETLRRALEIDPTQLKALVLAGTAAYQRGDVSNARALWERALRTGAADDRLKRTLEDSLAQLQPDAGGAPGAAPRGASGAAAATMAEAAASASPAASAGPFVSGEVSLSVAARAAVAADDTVFIFARAAGSGGAPLAVLRAQVRDLPLQFRLDDSLAMNPATPLSSAARVIVGARVSKRGSGIGQAGDWQALSEPVPLGTQALQLEIAQQRR